MSKLFCGEGGCRAHNTSAGKCSEIGAYGEVVIFVDSVVIRLFIRLFGWMDGEIRSVERNLGRWWDGDS